MSDRAANGDDNDPVTLHRVMQAMIGEGLKARYEAPQELSHELFVLLMQLKENERRRKARSAHLKSPSAREAARATPEVAGLASLSPADFDSLDPA
jgi:hypothetical protein